MTDKSDLVKILSMPKTKIIHTCSLALLDKDHNKRAEISKLMGTLSKETKSRNLSIVVLET